MDINTNVAFAQNATKSSIAEDVWVLGWVEIVGGINGVPTAQQFNEVCYVIDEKANLAFAKAAQALSSAQKAQQDLALAIEELNKVLNGKAPTSHKHSTSDITGLDETLGGFAEEDHSHAIGDVEGLQTTLDSKAPKSHGTHVTYATETPKANGTAAVGTSSKVAREDHVHPKQTDVDTIDGKHATDFAAITEVPSLLWSRRTEIPANADLNTYTEAGAFVIPDATTAASLNGTPSTVSGGYFDVYRRSATSVYHEFTPWTGKSTRRYLSGSTWSNWMNVSDGGNADTVDGKHATDFTLSYVNAYKPLITSIVPKDGAVTLSWLPVDGATKYAVCTYDAATGKYTHLTNTLTTTSYTATGLTNGTEYAFLVQAYVGNAWNKFDVTDHVYAIPEKINVPASETAEGYVTTGSQKFAGNKAFQGTVYLNGGSADSSASQGRNLASGTAAADTTNCPSGSWYGQHS